MINCRGIFILKDSDEIYSNRRRVSKGNTILKKIIIIVETSNIFLHITKLHIYMKNSIITFKKYISSLKNESIKLL